MTKLFISILLLALSNLSRGQEDDECSVHSGQGCVECVSHGGCALRLIGDGGNLATAHCGTGCNNSYSDYCYESSVADTPEETCAPYHELLDEMCVGRVTCPSCLRIEGCQWTAGGCARTCLADAACYSPQTFPDKNNTEICVESIEATADFVIRNQPSNCTACQATLTTDGSTPCVWTDAGSCKEPGCDSDGVCDVVDECPPEPATTTTTGTEGVTSCSSSTLAAHVATSCWRLGLWVIYVLHMV